MRLDLVEALAVFLALDRQPLGARGGGAGPGPDNPGAPGQEPVALQVPLREHVAVVRVGGKEDPEPAVAHGEVFNAGHGWGTQR